MTTTTMSYARSTGQPRRFAFDPWLIGTIGALLLAGLIMVASASIGVSERETGNAFFYFQRQLIFVGLGLVAALLAIAVPTSVWEKHSIYLLGGAFVLLVLVLVPGLGHEVNGSRRWVRLSVMNFQVSELARVMLLTLLAFVILGFALWYAINTIFHQLGYADDGGLSAIPSDIP